MWGLCTGEGPRRGAGRGRQRGVKGVEVYCMSSLVPGFCPAVQEAVMHNLQWVQQEQGADTDTVRMNVTSS